MSKKGSDFISSFKTTELLTPYNYTEEVLELNINDTSVYRLNGVVTLAGYYTFSIWYKSNKNTNITFDVLGDKSQISSDNNWKKFVKTVQITEVNDKNNYIDIIVDSGSIGYFYEAYLSEGESDTSWSPAPEDINDEFYEVRSEIKQTAEQINLSVKDIKGNLSKLDIKVGEITQEVSDVKENLSTEIKQTADKIDLIAKNKQDLIPHKIRYIRDWLNGNNIDTENRFVNIEINSNETNLSSGNVNLAKGLIPTSDVVISNPEYYTDGNMETYATLPSGNHYLQLDLGENANTHIDSICVWHYFTDARLYRHKLEVSIDGKTWFVLYDSEVYGEYKETSEGKIYYIDDTATNKKMAFINIDIDNITQRVQENENNFASISTQFDNITQRVEEVESSNQEIKNEDLPLFEESVNKKIAEIKVTADSITNTVENIQGELKKQGQEILDANGWRVTLANIGVETGAEPTETVSIILTHEGFSIQRSASEGYRTTMNGDTIKIEYDNGRNVYEPVMSIDKDEMSLTRVSVRNGIDHGTIKEIPTNYTIGDTNIAALLFIPGKNSKS